MRTRAASGLSPCAACNNGVNFKSFCRSTGTPCLSSCSTISAKLKNAAICRGGHKICGSNLISTCHRCQRLKSLLELGPRWVFQKYEIYFQHEVAVGSKSSLSRE